jgi:hypothetical protein
MPGTSSIRQEVKKKNYWTFVSADTLKSVDMYVAPNKCAVRCLGCHILTSTSDIESWTGISPYG